MEKSVDDMQFKEVLYMYTTEKGFLRCVGLNNGGDGELDYSKQLHPEIGEKLVDVRGLGYMSYTGIPVRKGGTKANTLTIYRNEKTGEVVCDEGGLTQELIEIYEKCEKEAGK